MNAFSCFHPVRPKNVLDRGFIFFFIFCRPHPGLELYYHGRHAQPSQQPTNTADTGTTTTDVKVAIVEKKAVAEAMVAKWTSWWPRRWPPHQQSPRGWPSDGGRGETVAGTRRHGGFAMYLLT
jgi:hypothetical protein